ncbi:cyclic nucleotide-binding domain-containing protein [Paenibacillus hemerocallicola]|uniref:cyclic nucleotide-binding domain-containing protein n=1 Tax=Paenibacillus hemerocallicola TaxID=1172614 RepID=UPI00159EBDCD|nr:cyclic nucleotide-binding domain-containing protein [Paenibacillus hemerocallicola]
MNKLTFLEIPLFEGLDRVHKAALLQEFTQLSYCKGDLLFEEGEFGDSLYIVMQGKARIYLGSGTNETTLAILGEKEYFGEMALLTGDPRSASARAESDLVVLKLIKESFDRILYEHNALAVQFAGILAKRLARVNRQSSSEGLTRDDPAISESMLSEEIRSTSAATDARPSEYRGEVSIEADRWRSPLSRALCMTVSLISGLLTYYAMRAGGEPNTVCALGAIGITALLLTACGVASLPLVSVLMGAAAVSLPGVEFEYGRGIAAASAPLLTALALTMSAQAMYRSGVVQRLLLALALRFQNKGKRYGAMIEIMSALSVLLLPSSRLRSDAFALLQIKDRERRHADAYSLLFIQSSSLCWFAMALIPGALADNYGFSHWMMAALPLVAVMFLYNTAKSFMKREGELFAPDPAILSAQLSIMGSWSIKETAALIIMLGGGLAMVLAPWLGISLLGISLLMVLALTVCGLMSKTIAGEVKYEPYIVFALLVGVAGLYEGSGMQHLTAGWISHHMSAAGALVALFAVVLLLSRFIPPMMAIFAGMICIGTGSVVAGASPAQAAVVVVLASQLQYDRLFTMKTWNQIMLNKIVPACLAVLLAIPLWHWTAAWTEMPVPSSAPALLAGDSAAPEVPFAVILPGEASAAASIKQGVELAVADLKLSSDLPPLKLRPDYRGNGEAGRIEDPAPAPVFAIAAAQTDSANRQGLPAIILNGALAAADRSVALAPSPEVYAKEVADLLVRQGYDKVAIYYEDSNPGKQFAAALEKAADQRGKLVVDRLTRIPARTALINASNRWRILETEAVIVYDSSGEATSEISAGLEASGAQYPLIAGPSIPGTDFLLAYKGEVYGYSDFDVNADRLRTAAFAERYRSAYGTAPSRMAAAAYDAVRLIAMSAGLAAAAEPDPMYEALEGIGPWEGVVRTYNFKSRDEADNGKLVQIFSLTPKYWRTEGTTR